MNQKYQINYRKVHSDDIITKQLNCFAIRMNININKNKTGHYSTSVFSMYKDITKLQTPNVQRQSCVKFCFNACINGQLKKLLLQFIHVESVNFSLFCWILLKFPEKLNLFKSTYCRDNSFLIYPVGNQLKIVQFCCFLCLFTYKKLCALYNKKSTV